jgi:phage repressor protein C with HTH and peptisase S24 domain
MEIKDQRAALERLIVERNEDYAGLSRLIGKNAAYIQQFIRRGVPKRLNEADRRTLAKYFGVDDQLLGGPAARLESADRFVPIPVLNVGASAGSGALGDAETAIGHMAFDRGWLRQLRAGTTDALSLISVQGDSMEPTLADGDDILVDRTDTLGQLRDGIYVLRREDTLMVKRLAINPSASKVTIKSDNQAYPDWTDCPLHSVQIIGRVIWAGRKVR